MVLKRVTGVPHDENCAVSVMEPLESFERLMSLPLTEELTIEPVCVTVQVTVVLQGRLLTEYVSLVQSTSPPVME
jgi:hypothetical protein